MTDAQKLILATIMTPDLKAAMAGAAVIEAPSVLAVDEQDRGRVHVVITTGAEPLGAAEFDALPNLGLIVTFGSGFDGVDMAAATARGIGLATGSGVHADDVADGALSLFLAVTRRVVDNDALVRQGQWRQHRVPLVRSVADYAIGIVGMGAVGKAVAHRLTAFGCNIGWTGPSPKAGVALPYVPDLLALARQSDALILTAPLNDSTRGMIDRTIIDAVGGDGLIINVGRGGLIDEDALIAALRDGRLGAAALDVFWQEPTPAERWRDVPNVLLSPHSAGMTFQALSALATNAGKRASAFVRGTVTL